MINTAAKTQTQANATDFDAAFSELLRAFRHHEDLRARRAETGELSRSSQDLFRARMAMRWVNG